MNEDYWYNQWHLDYDLHHLLAVKDVTKISRDEPTSIYADTDSCKFDSIVETRDSRLSIEDWYNRNIMNGSGGKTLSGHESVLTKDEILNYKDGNLYYVPVKRIIRHKVTKPKWKLKTKSGKEITVTNDHSMIIFRDGVQLEVKPSEILITDKILIVKEPSII